MEEQEKTVVEKLNEQIEQAICEIVDSEMVKENITQLGELIDIHKDLANEEYWKTKKEEIKMRYREYGNYNGYGNDSYGRRGVPGTGRGRYRESGSYGRRGYDTKYKGEESLNGMYEGFRDYSDSKDMYGNDSQTMESYEYMLKSLKDFYKHLTKEASSQEEVEMLRDTIQEMAQM